MNVSLYDAKLFGEAELALQAIQDIPSLRHTPILDRHERDRDTALELCLKKSLDILSEAERKRITDEFFEYGPLMKLQDEEAVTEIMIMGPDSIWVERQGKIERHNDRFLNRITYRSCLNRILRASKAYVDEARPFANGRWDNFRIHAVGAPIVFDLPCLTLRRIRHHRWTLQELADAGWTNSRGARILREVIGDRQNVLVIGATGSGKTSVLSAAINEVRDRERVLILEDTDEIPIPNSVSIKLLTKTPKHSDDTGYQLGDLLKQALRMRPDRLVMGEVRGAEAKDLLLAFATGHNGCWGTLHALNAREALLRLEMLVQMGAPQWTTQTVRSLIHSSIHYILNVEKTPEGRRRLNSINKVASLEEVGFCFSTIYQA
jgi:pilus assembly protein CpaF